MVLRSNLDRFFVYKFKYLPVISVIVVFITKILILSFTKQSYTFDEFMVSEISKYDFKNLMTVIVSEPNPPLFYIFLKSLPIDVFSARIVMSIISFIIFIAAFLYATKTRIFEHKFITVSVLIFIFNFNFYEQTSYLKPNAIGLPIVFFVFFVILNDLKSKEIIIKKYILISLISIFLLFFSYVYFTYSIIMLCIYSILKFNKYIVTSGFVIILVTIFYYLIFMQLQVEANKIRFDWIKYYPNDLFSAISAYLFLSYDYAIIIEILVLFLGFFTILNIFIRKSLIQFDKQELFVYILTISVVIISYFLHFYVKIRYSSFTIFIAFILVSDVVKGITKISMKVLGYVFCVVIIILYCNANLNFYRVLNANYNLYRNLNHEFSLNKFERTNALTEKKVVFSTRATSRIYIYECCKNQPVYGVNLARPVFDNPKDIISNKFSLFVDKYDLDLAAIPEDEYDLNNLKNSKKFLNLKDFYFLYSQNEFIKINNLYMSYFNAVCKVSTTKKLTTTLNLVKYDNCN